MIRQPRVNVFFAIGMAAICFSCQANTVSYSIPVLTVQSDGLRVIPGSGKLSRCAFSLDTTTNMAPVKVAVSENRPLGAGDMMRSSLWQAVTTASLTLNRVLSGTTVSFETSGYVDGPSASGVLCLAIMSAMEGRLFPDDFAMTGTIMADGTVGSVGGVSEKIKAAKKAGIKRICIPSSVRVEKDVDLLDLAEKEGMEIYPVASIDDAYRIMHSHLAHSTLSHSSEEVCRMPRSFERALKNLFSRYAKKYPRDERMWNRLMVKSWEEYRSGLFAAAVFHAIQSLEDWFGDRSRGANSAFNASSMLSATFPDNGKSVTKESDVEALKALHEDLKRVEKELLDADRTRQGARNSSGGVPNDWFADIETSPADIQNCFFVFEVLLREDRRLTECAKITNELDGIKDWSALDDSERNRVRELLEEKRMKLNIRKSAAEECVDLDSVVRDLDHEGFFSFQYMQPHTGLQQIGRTFFDTMASMHAVLSGEDLGTDYSGLVNTYHQVFDGVIGLNPSEDEEGDEILKILVCAKAISMSCALLTMRESTENLSFYSSVVSTARDNAIASIAQCKADGVPCMMPILYFQVAEAVRDDYSSDVGLTSHRFKVLANYLSASLSAKALALCFAGQKPQLNAAGYCSIDRTVDDNESGSCLTIRYMGVDGKPIMRPGGIAGYKRYSTGENEDLFCWLDLSGREVRCQQGSMRWTQDFDDKRRVRKTYCNDVWVPTPMDDGVLYETFGYDADGNETSWEFFGASSNRVISCSGMAIIKKRYNERGEEVWRRFFGIDGEPVVHKEGNAGFDVDYKNGCKLMYVDLKGCPVMTTRGYAMVEEKYDGKDRLCEESRYDAQGKLICVGGFARVRLERDETGCVTVEAYYDAEDRLVRVADDTAAVQHVYDQSGEEIECRFYGPDSEPTLHKDGYTVWKLVADKSGRIVRRYYDLNGNVVDIKKVKR